MTLEQLKAFLYDVETICAPDEFHCRQRRLLVALARYIVERDKPEVETVNYDS
jgi:hypothetical protein